MAVCHITSAHPLDDVRIVRKEVRSLVNAGYDVSVVGTAGRIDPFCCASLIELPRPAGGRLSRMLRHTDNVVNVAIDLSAKIYHLHDPELLPFAPKLRRGGGKVVYDAHESLRLQVLSKPYLPRVLRPSVSIGAAALMRWAGWYCDAIVSATPAIAAEFPADKTVLVQNYPLLDEFSLVDNCERSMARTVVYVGGIDAARGALELVEAMSHIRAEDARLVMAGEFSGADIESRCRLSAGWEKVNYRGWLDRVQVAQLLGQSLAGVVTYLPEPNHIDAQPNKLFEYMAAGLAVIASDFPLWRHLVERNNCGMLVDPGNSQAIAEAIDWLIDHPEEARAMGERGRRAVAEELNWENEAQKLLTLYERLLG